MTSSNKKQRRHHLVVFDESGAGLRGRNECPRSQYPEAERQLVYIKQVFVPGDQYVRSGLGTTFQERIVLGVPADLKYRSREDNSGT